MNFCAMSGVELAPTGSRSETRPPIRCRCGEMVQPEIRGHDGDTMASFRPPVWSVPTHYDPRPGVAPPLIVTEPYADSRLGGPHVDPLDTASRVGAILLEQPAARLRGVEGW